MQIYKQNTFFWSTDTDSHFNLRQLSAFQNCRQADQRVISVIFSSLFLVAKFIPQLVGVVEGCYLACNDFHKYKILDLHIILLHNMWQSFSVFFVL